MRHASRVSGSSMGYSVGWLDWPDVTEKVGKGLGRDVNSFQRRFVHFNKLDLIG